MSKKLVLAAAAVATLAVATVSTTQQAEAGKWNGGAFAAGAAIGLAGGIIASHAYNPHPVYYGGGGYYGGRRVCEWRERFNKWGDYIGSKRVCYRVY